MKQKKITDQEALELFSSNPITKGKHLTPYKLIVANIVTFDDWLNAIKKGGDINEFYGHAFERTNFGRKTRRFIKTMGFQNFSFGHQFKKQTTNHKLEAIRLINISIFMWREG
ncbi:hypothetical protein WG904_03465 [Pedobacter sp. Du54]|uniref:hypothetical protein n=1 Tax=Pedobacter anseongensis TaxID=3133439 RepID=UPI0030A70E23